MSHAYIVVATRDSEIEACEVFSGVQSALGRAFQLASDKSNRNTHLINTTPGEETLPDGSLRWVFMDTNKQSVVVFYRKIEDALLSSKDPMSVIGGLSNTKDVPKTMAPSLPSFTSDGYAAPIRGTLHLDPIIPLAQLIKNYLDPASVRDGYAPPIPAPVPAYDPEDRSLPAGWLYSGAPALMSDMQDDPFDVKDPLYDLTDQQKWALVEARVRKSPGYRGAPKGYSGFSPDQATSLAALKERSQFGEQVRDGEIEFLHHMRKHYSDQ